MAHVGTVIDHLAVARRYADDPVAWPVAPRFSATGRWYARIAEHREYEVWLLTWLPGQGTDLHDHGGSAGALHVVSGSLVEDVVAPVADGGFRMNVRHLDAGIGHAFGPRYVHRIVNRSRRPAVSVHVYGPALTSMTRYRLSAVGLEVAEVERAGVQW
ncbi:cysteine dioxygenase type I [Krasilnikovia cinnamomea]|uniref:Cysteine dioxygenase type I n=1 Tax=Krasilnikovia cinnamomea TaxID=349313 RepID=A0A4Q7ZMF2_9ACTN|nr:cysteine dioxygenase family protein [Krasilnikovia cinnamomea]RZU51804.1 cysteine dioxygenase type I [Krasilnikovia cinnamomea]